MLDPRSREMLMTSLRPPDGYRFDCAIGTTFSLDLIALLTTPLAFAMFDREQESQTPAEQKELSGDPLALLESLRRCADRIHVFCQAGQIKVPPANQRLLLYLEQMVIEVQPPCVARGVKGVFHPKVWILRFIDEHESVKYRLLCLSRNLTFDRSWDTVLVLDGDRTDRQRAFSVNSPLVEFVSALPKMAVRGDSINPQAQVDIKLIETELRVVDWDKKGLNVEEIQFVPLGLSGKTPFPDRMDQLLIVSPFVEPGFLNRFSKNRQPKHLVSRPDVLNTLPADCLQSQWSCYMLEDGLESTTSAEAPDTTSALPELSGLHAKLFVIDEGWKAHVFTGSANATNAAFGGNVEFLVRLTGMKSKLGVGVFMDESPNVSNLRTLLTKFDPSDEPVVADATAKMLEDLLYDCRSRIVEQAFLAEVRRDDERNDCWVTILSCETVLELPASVSVSCRPAMLPANYAYILPTNGPIRLSFGPHSKESISSFVAFDFTATFNNVTAHSSFVLNLPLTGTPCDRREDLLRSLLKDTNTLLRFLMVLLSDDPEMVLGELQRQSMQDQANDGGAGDNTLPLLEQLLLALQNNPEKLSHIQRIVDDLSADHEDPSILTPEFRSVWDPIFRVASKRQKQSARKGTK
jgi:hypothetical protein